MIRQTIAAHMIRSLSIVILFTTFTISSKAQTAISFNDLSAFNNPGKNWKLAGKVTADLGQANVLRSTKGQGLLVNDPDKKTAGTDLYTKDEFSDMDLEVDYMMAKGSNSGIYLQGRYELQLRDSWGLIDPGAAGNGGIYERFDESRGKGNEGYQGYAPRQNVSRAPGLWQHLKVSFQAPRFDAAGHKIANAKMLRVELNGVIIHENIELTGPTRGGMNNNEVASGPLRLQGDHGPVAFRNLTVNKYQDQPPVLANIHYALYYSKYTTIPDFSKLKPDEEGSLPKLSTSFLKKDQEFLIRYTGIVQIRQPGSYIFQRETAGAGAVKINNQEVSTVTSYTTTPIQLDAGDFPFEIVYTKPFNWAPTSFGLTISSNNVREFLASDESSLFREYPDPILIEPRERLVNRSFMDITEGNRVVHSANVGSPDQLHYSYDMDRGNLFQVWRGGFLDATPMWYSRGDGSSRPTGSRVQLGQPRQSIVQLSSLQDSLSNDTTGTGFRTKGYELESDSRTAFIYWIHGATVRDAFEVSENGQALKRTVKVANNPGKLYMLLAAGKTIESVSKGLYVIDDNSYYIRLDDAGAAPVVRQSNGHSELLIPVQDTLSYSILF
jgi:hypothetical protein